MNEMKRIIKLEPLEHNVGNYLKTLAKQNRYHNYFCLFMAPLIEESIMLNPDNIFRSIEYEHELTICSLVRDSSLDTVQLDISFYGNLETSYPSYDKIHGFTSTDEVNALLKKIGSPEFSNHLIKTLMDKYEYLIHKSVLVHYDEKAMQLVIPVNETLTIDITVTVDTKIDKATSHAIN